MGPKLWRRCGRNRVSGCNVSDRLDSRDEVHQIANVLPQMESLEFLELGESHQIANVLPQMESLEFLELDESHQIANVLPQMESSEFLEPELLQLESRQTKGPAVKHLYELLTTAVEFHQTKAGANN